MPPTGRRPAALPEPWRPAEREKLLAQWVQQLLAQLRRLLEQERERYQRLQAAHAVLTHREWFTLPSPVAGEGDRRVLYCLEKNEAIPLCTLYENDVLLIGRGERPGKEERDAPGDLGQADGV